MSAPDLLRRAAQKLRERAGRATPVPGQLARYGRTSWGVDGDVRAGDHAWVAEMKFGEERADAEYIALMHPPVALALADWLDLLADGAAEGVGITPERAEAVARAVLREPPGKPEGGEAP